MIISRLLFLCICLNHAVSTVVLALYSFIVYGVQVESHITSILLISSEIRTVITHFVFLSLLLEL